MTAGARCKMPVNLKTIVRELEFWGRYLEDICWYLRNYWAILS